MLRWDINILYILQSKPESVRRCMSRFKNKKHSLTASLVLSCQIQKKIPRSRLVSRPWNIGNNPQVTLLLVFFFPLPSGTWYCSIKQSTSKFVNVCFLVQLEAWITQLTVSLCHLTVHHTPHLPASSLHYLHHLSVFHTWAFASWDKFCELALQE